MGYSKCNTFSLFYCISWIHVKSSSCLQFLKLYFKILRLQDEALVYDTLPVVAVKVIYGENKIWLLKRLKSALKLCYCISCFYFSKVQAYSYYWIIKIIPTFSWNEMCLLSFNVRAMKIWFYWEISDISFLSIFGTMEAESKHRYLSLFVSIKSDAGELN